MVEEFTYQLQVDQLSRKNNTSESKSREFIKNYRRLLKERLREGYKIDMVGIACIWPSVRESVNEVFEEDEIYSYNSQIKDLCVELNLRDFEAHAMLRSYLSMISMRLKMGYSIKISGVLLIRPDLLDDDTLGYVTRLSPTLEKPESINLKVKRIYGNIEVLEVPIGKIIFRQGLSEDLGFPKKLRFIQDTGDKFQRIDDDILG